MGFHPGKPSSSPRCGTRSHRSLHHSHRPSHLGHHAALTAMAARPHPRHDPPMMTAATTTKVAALAFKTPTPTHPRCAATSNEEMSGKGPSLTTPRWPPAPEPTTGLARSFHHRLALPSREKDKLPGGTPSQPRGKDDSVALLPAELSVNDERRLGADQPFDRGSTCTPRGRNGGRIDSPQDESTPEHSPAVAIAETAESQCSRHVAGRPPRG